MRSDETFPPALAAERALDRRRLLCVGAAATALAVLGEWAAERPSSVPPVAGHVSLDATEPLAVGEARALAMPEGIQVLAVRLDADTVVAFDRRCPHLGCPVVWAAARARFECPCHRAAFDARTGQVLFGPPRRGLGRVEIG